MVITSLSSDEQVLWEVGARVRRMRIDTPLTQEQLAVRAGVSLSVVARLERGGDVRLSGLVSILRALGLLANLDALVPDVVVRPSDIAGLGHARQRASSTSRKTTGVSHGWKWGDEQ